MKILFVAAEANPLVKVGGLADVVGSLPQALKELGHDVRILIPQYGAVDIHRFAVTPEIKGFSLPFQGHNLTFDLNRTRFSGIPVYLLYNQLFFGSRDIYTAADLERFFFFSRAVFEILPHLAWQPDIVHCHDWHTSLLIMWLKKAVCPYSSVFTIHNLAHQGTFDNVFLNTHSLRKDWDRYPAAAPPPPQCFLSHAILRADLITTVSETYAREIATPQMGMGLDKLLRYRQDSLSGIINGLNYREWDPQTDACLPVNFNSGSLEKRAQNKAALQQQAGLPFNEKVPLIGMVQRLDPQKGMDILAEAVEPLIRETGAQLVVLGSGWEVYKNMLLRLASVFPQNMAVFTDYQEVLAHRIYGGCDIFLMPSQFEPCGLGQLIAMRYGSVPVVRHTGGLVDTVPGFSPDLQKGHGFVFHQYSSAALLKAVKAASQAFQDREIWLRAVRRLMSLDYSWQSSARLYDSLYQRVLEKGKT